MHFAESLDAGYPSGEGVSALQPQAVGRVKHAPRPVSGDQLGGVHADCRHACGIAHRERLADDFLFRMWLEQRDAGSPIGNDHRLLRRLTHDPAGALMEFSNSKRATSRRPSTDRWTSASSSPVKSRAVACYAQRNCTAVRRRLDGADADCPPQRAKSGTIVGCVLDGSDVSPNRSNRHDGHEPAYRSGRRDPS